jgi:hypothetical protein
MPHFHHAILKFRNNYSCVKCGKTKGEEELWQFISLSEALFVLARPEFGA